MTKISAQKRKKNTELLRAFLKDIRQNKVRQYNKNANRTNKKKKKKKKTKSRKKRKKLRGGSVSLEFETPQAQNVSANGAIQQAMSKQKLNSSNMVELNKAMNGGGVSVPQMSQAGGEGNSLMKSVTDLQLQTRAMSEHDADALKGRPQGIGGMTGGRKSRKNRRKRRKRKTKRTKQRKRRKSRRRKK